jgi:hypothetical protein
VMIQASADDRVETTRKTSAGSNKTLSSELREHTGLAECRLCTGSSDATVWVFTQGFMPLGDGLVCERHWTDHRPTCVAELKSGPVTTMLKSVTQLWNKSETHTVDSFVS